MKAIISTWKTLTDTLNVLNRERSNWLYPLLSFAILLVSTFAVLIPLLEQTLGGMHETGLMQLFFFLVVYFMYGLLYFVVTFCNVALLNNIVGQLDGGKPSRRRGLAAALPRSGPIALYTGVSATKGLVSLLAKVLLNPILGKVIVPLVGKRSWQHWRQLSASVPLLMAVPIIALDQPVPKQFFKRSEQMVKKTWGEQVKPAHSIGLLALLVLLPILLLFALPALQQGAAEHNAKLTWQGLSILLVAISVYIQLSAMVNAIFALGAYRYATAQKSDLFPGDISYTAQAFVKSAKATNQGEAVSASLSASPSVIVDDGHLR